MMTRTNDPSERRAHNALDGHGQEDDMDKCSLASRSHSFSAAPDRPSQEWDRPIRHTRKDGYKPGTFGQPRPPPKSKLTLISSANPTQPSQTSNESEGKAGSWEDWLDWIWRTFPTQTINGLLLLLPLLYWSRVTAIFTEVQCSESALENAVKENCQTLNQNQDTQTPASNHFYLAASECPEVKHLKDLWDDFIHAVTKEWETMNLVAILLVGTIIASMQIGPIFADEILRYLAFAALVCGLMSLVFSCIYIIRFSIMRPIHKAVEWAKEGAETKTNPFWNVWVFLSIPAIWLSWSLILFVAEIVAFLWLCDSPDSAKTLRPRVRIAAKVAISVILGIGIIYLGLVLSTLKRYGAQMDEKWKKRFEEELKTGKGDSTVPKIPDEAFQRLKFNDYIPPLPAGYIPPPLVPMVRGSLAPSPAETLSVNQSPDYLTVPTNRSSTHGIPRRSPEPVLPDGDQKAIKSFEPVMAAELFLADRQNEELTIPTSEVWQRLGDPKVWTDFIQEIVGICRDGLPHQAWMRLPDVLRRWNQNRLQPQRMEAVLVCDIGPPPSHVHHYMIYVMDLSFSSDHSRHFLDLPDGVEKREIMDDTGVVKLRLVLPRNAERSNVDQAQGSQSYAFSSDGGTVPPSSPASGLFGAPDPSGTGPFSDLSRKPAKVRFEGFPVAEATKNVEKKLLLQPPSAIRASRSGSPESKSVRYMDETPNSPTVFYNMNITPIQEGSKTTEGLATRRPSGPGISPLLRRHLSHRFFHDHASAIEETYSVDERSSPATLISTPTLVISHKQIPHKFYVKKEPLITINDLLSELGKQLHKPVTDDYLRGLEPEVVRRLRTVAEQRARVDGKSAEDPATEAIRAVDLIWSENITGFVELPDGTWQLETQEH